MGKDSKYIKEILSWLKYVSIAVVIALFLNSFIIINASVASASMETTIMTKDKIFGLRTSYWFSEPKRFDVIVFKPPMNPEGYPYVKRIIGLPSEILEIKGGKVYINNNETPLEEKFLKIVAEGDFGPFVIPEDCYFVLGDNRNDSWDSKNWGDTFLSKNQILGKAYYIYIPKIEQIK